MTDESPKVVNLQGQPVEPSGDTLSARYTTVGGYPNTGAVAPSSARVATSPSNSPKATGGTP